VQVLGNSLYVTVKLKDCGSSLQKSRAVFTVKRMHLVSHHYLHEHEVMSTEHVEDAEQ